MTLNEGNDVEHRLVIATRNGVILERSAFCASPDRYGKRSLMHLNLTFHLRPLRMRTFRW